VTMTVPAGQIAPAPAGLACSLCWHPADLVDPVSGALLCCECFTPARPVPAPQAARSAGVPGRPGPVEVPPRQ
jgi:hypothetical protein